VSGSELAARRMMAAAILADWRRFNREAPISPPPGPEWQQWAARLAVALGGLLDAMEETAAADPGPDGEKLAAIREVLAHFDWEFHDRQLALERIEQIAGGEL
jgi:hypothetical protein